MTTLIKPFDVVVVADDLPVKKLLRGQVGTVVEVLAPNMFEVEFCDDEGRTYMFAALETSQLRLVDCRSQAGG